MMLAPSDTPPGDPRRANVAALTARLIAVQLRHEACEAATTSRDFGRGLAHAASTVERIAAAMEAA